MSSHSQNGWPVATAAQQDTAPLYGNVTVPNGVLKGDVAFVFRWLADRYHHAVEPLIKGTCWGWYVKPIEGSTTISNHASGTAVDLNADQHPMGKPASANMTSGQIAACRAIVDYADGVIRWGGDYSGRPDPMHWEIVKDAAAVKRLRTKIEEDDVALSSDDKKWISAEITKQLGANLVALLTIKINDEGRPNRTIGDVLRDTAKLRGVLVGDTVDTENAAVKPGSPLDQLVAFLDVQSGPSAPAPPTK